MPSSERPTPAPRAHLHRLLAPARLVGALGLLSAVAIALSTSWAPLALPVPHHQPATHGVPWVPALVLGLWVLAPILQPRWRWSGRAAAALLPVLAILWLELGTRAWVQLGAPPDQREQLLQLGSHAESNPERDYLGHPFLHYLGNPGSPEFNSQGYLGPERTTAKPEGTLRVACVGGSTTANSYPEQLEQRLQTLVGADTPVEVLNFGALGWTSLHSLVNLAVGGVDYQPDYVVVLHAHNDVAILGHRGERRDYACSLHPYCYQTPRPTELWLLRHSMAYRVHWRRYWRNQSTPAPSPLAIPTGSDDTSGFCPSGGPSERPGGRLQPFQRHMGEIVALTRLHGATPVLATMPSSSAHQDRTTPDLSEANEVVRRLAREGGEAVLLADLAQQLAEPLQPHFLDPIHLDEGGCAIEAAFIAELIAADLQTRRSEAEVTVED